MPVNFGSLNFNPISLNKSSDKAKKQNFRAKTAIEKDQVSFSYNSNKKASKISFKGLVNGLKKPLVVIIDRFNPDKPFILQDSYAHGGMVRKLIEKRAPHTAIKEVNIERITMADALIDVSRASEKPDAVNISLSNNLGIEQLGKLLKLPLSPENLREFREGIIDKIFRLKEPETGKWTDAVDFKQVDDFKQLFKAGRFPLRFDKLTSAQKEDALNKFMEKQIRILRDNQIYKVLKIQKLAAKDKIPVYIAAGNDGKEVFNLFSLAKGVTTIGSAGKVKGKTVVEKYSADNSLITRFEDGKVDLELVTDGEKFGIRVKDPASTSREIDFKFDFSFSGPNGLNETAIANHFIDSVDKMTIRPKRGTSYASPRALANDLLKQKS